MFIDFGFYTICRKRSHVVKSNTRAIFMGSSHQTQMERSVRTRSFPPLLDQPAGLYPRNVRLFCRPGIDSASRLSSVDWTYHHSKWLGSLGKNYYQLQPKTADWRGHPSRFMRFVRVCRDMRNPGLSTCFFLDVTTSPFVRFECCPCTALEGPWSSGSAHCGLQNVASRRN